MTNPDNFWKAYILFLTGGLMIGASMMAPAHASQAATILQTLGSMAAGGGLTLLLPKNERSVLIAQPGDRAGDRTISAQSGQ